MAFSPENKNIPRTLNEHRLINDTITDKLNIPIFSEKNEKTKNYTFSLQPSVRQKIDTLAEQHNFNSTSKFLNELFKNM